MKIVRGYTTDGQLLVQGKPVDIGTGLSEGDFDVRMIKANLIDQLSIEYPRGCPLSRPAEGEDPGRLRNDAFFLSSTQRAACL